ncbi:MAG: UDP-2,3-diacylglucosamine diphosphatase [Clostridium sp.]|nr:UDP-2,3-diacylglucosamine diphosphatase [Prevotella sp.]MCM1428281.1 UDP-2,3-diacylglucosamine diphosphatase [Clostridium sp.]MCM1476235.1 UDP-2,3-diacylglucosamine diphosphatase [Muribaculaceae bacterium]
MGKTYFLSDLHLGAPYFPDSREAEDRVVKFLDFIKEDADALYLLGDILDYWYEYRNVVPRGYVRFFGKLAELADREVEITWIIGNHDIWMFDYLRDEIGIDVVDGPIDRKIYGEEYHLAHGDGLGKTPFVFKTLRGLFRNRFCQWLYAGIHPRWTVPFAQRWSRSSRQNANKSKKPSPNKTIEEHLSTIIEYSENHTEQHKGKRHYVYGHYHIAHEMKISKGNSLTMLGDWISQFTYGEAESGRPIRLKRWVHDSKSNHEGEKQVKNG